MKRVVIIGGGFAGSLIAKGLQNNFSTLLIDTKDYFEFTPGILRTLVEPVHLKKIHVMHTDYLPKVKFVRGIVQEVDKYSVYVKIKSKIKKISFDYLVIASGSSYTRLIKDKDVVAVTRAKKLRDHYKKFIDEKKIIIVGGGIVGVELAAEIATHYPQKEIHILEVNDRLVSRQNKKVSEYVKKFLLNRNVKLHFKDQFQDYKNKQIMTTNKKSLHANFVFSCVGIKPNSFFMKKYFSDHLDKGYIKVNKFLQLEKHKNIFVAGDVTNFKEEKLAQNAENHAWIIIQNIKRISKNNPLKEYHSKPRIMVISLGKYDGILSYKNFFITGLIPGLLKSAIEWWFMRNYH